MPSTELAWAAGFFDGEGSTSCSNCKGWGYVRLSVPQKDLRPLERFRAAVAVECKVYRASTRGVTELMIYRQDDVKDVLNKLWPYLSEPKKEQALAAFDKKDAMAAARSDAKSGACSSLA